MPSENDNQEIKETRERVSFRTLNKLKKVYKIRSAGGILAHGIVVKWQLYGKLSILKAKNWLLHFHIYFPVSSLFLPSVLFLFPYFHKQTTNQPNHLDPPTHPSPPFLFLFPFLGLFSFLCKVNKIWIKVTVSFFSVLLEHASPPIVGMSFQLRAKETPLRELSCSQKRKLRVCTKKPRARVNRRSSPFSSSLLLFVLQTFRTYVVDCSLCSYLTYKWQERRDKQLREKERKRENNFLIKRLNVF